MLVFGVPAALQQQRYSPTTKEPVAGIVVDRARVFIVALIRKRFAGSEVDGSWRPPT
jgi:hypothetical protein